MFPPAVPGLAVQKIDTPALIIDLDAFEQNLHTMADELRGSGVHLRAHSKTHKSPIIAIKQIALGACGICCQKVSEAEIFVQAGVHDILISNEIVGQSKLGRLAALARQAKITVCVDHPDNIRKLASAADKLGSRIHVLVEIDVGAGRCGVLPGRPALELVRVVQSFPALHFAGLQAYHGTAQHIRSAEERKRAIERTISLTVETAELLKGESIDCDIISGGGTGTYEFEASSGVFNEIQAGSYVFMDLDYSRNLQSDGRNYSRFQQSLFIYTTVMSTAKKGQVVVDAGLKSVSVDSGLPEPFDLASSTYTAASDEHGVLITADGGVAPSLGDKILLVPGHCDPTVNLHDWYVGVRNLDGPHAYVESLWPVAARGCVF